MNRARTLLALVGLAVLLALGGGTLMFMAGHARYGPWGAGMPFGGHFMMGDYSGAYGRLDLTPQQREQLDRLQLGLFQQEATLATQMYEPDAQLRKMYAAGTSDAAALDPVFAKIAGIQRQVFQARLAAKIRFEALLTPEQRQRLKELPQETGTPTPW